MASRFLTPLLLAPLLLASCGTAPNEPAANPPPTPAQQATRLARLKLDYGAPVAIDSTAYVMYPLVLGVAEEKQGIESGSYSRGASTYWNVAFYNTRTGAHHLLNDRRKMVIHNFSGQNDAADAPSGGAASGARRRSLVNGFLYFDVTTQDFNRDGKLDGDDPRCLFISDKTGRRFQQISPPNAHVASWQLVGATGKVLMLVGTDTNHDRAFTDRDETTPLVYDLRAGTGPGEVFGKVFTTQARQQLDAQWPTQP